MKAFAIKLEGGKWLGHWGGRNSPVPSVGSVAAARVYSCAMFALLALNDLKISRGIYGVAVQVDL